MLQRFDCETIKREGRGGKGREEKGGEREGKRGRGGEKRTYMQTRTKLHKKLLSPV